MTPLLKNQAFINGKWIAASDHSTFEVINPANGEIIERVSDCAEAEVKMAIDAAWNAWQSWKNRTAYDRCNLLRKWFELIGKNKMELADIMTREQGKPLHEAEGEIQYAASFVEWFAAEGLRTYGETIPAPASKSRFVTIRQPVGVVAAITPWNFPSAMITRKVAPALAAGCTVIVKPSEETPFSALALAALAEKAGIPSGVLNVVTTKNAPLFSDIIFSNKRVRKISFTGSTPVGKKLMKAASDSIKKISLELGGNAPFIVFEDAHIKQAVKGVRTAKFRNNGQACIAANRIFVHETIYEKFASELVGRVEKMRIGGGTEKGVELGPMINEGACNKLDRLIADAVKKGANILNSNANNEKSGLFYPPVVLGNCSEKMDIFHEEIFGPVAALYVFKDFDEVIKMANNTNHGLAAYLYSQDVARCWTAAEQLEYGMTGINSGFISDASTPFGGIKESGIGREGSRYGIDEYLEIKYMSFGGISTN
ncbi:MAG: NAD-dependent succinate-semialdehyde dehydrogenase [Saprospirales bacterium]|nr:MAG: NAD-dependent succinate-semialdehyde dehydrogenase [Saprospirales bacterium]